MKNKTNPEYPIDGISLTDKMIDSELEASEIDIKNGDCLTHSHLKIEIEKWRTSHKGSPPLFSRGGAGGEV